MNFLQVHRMAVILLLVCIKPWMKVLTTLLGQLDVNLYLLYKEIECNHKKVTIRWI